MPSESDISKERLATLLEKVEGHRPILPHIKEALLDPELVNMIRKDENSNRVGRKDGKWNFYELEVLQADGSKKPETDIGYGRKLTKEEMSRGTISVLGKEVSITNMSDDDIDLANVESLVEITSQLVDRLDKRDSPVTMKALKALIPLSYQLGAGALTDGFPNVMEHIYNGQYSKAAEELGSNSEGTGPSLYKRQTPERAQRHIDMLKNVPNVDLKMLRRIQKLYEEGRNDGNN